jgi:hypothetical protein
MVHTVSMRQRTPQEKKLLSLKKDRRNTYGESPHGARKTIPLRKRLRARAERRFQVSQSRQIRPQMDSDTADAIESAVRSFVPSKWGKVPDSPLGEVIEAKKHRRIRSYCRKYRSRVRMWAAKRAADADDGRKPKSES